MVREVSVCKEAEAEVEADEADAADEAVEDNGPGIPKESREHVFEMFYSGKNKVSDSRRSLGLGLALCRSIVNAHGGEIALYDYDPQGCCFRINLPLSEVNLNE